MMAASQENRSKQILATMFSCPFAMPSEKPLIVAYELIFLPM
jgi:hypothetical protein